MIVQPPNDAHPEAAEIMMRVLLPALAAGDVRLCPRCCRGLYEKPGHALNEVEQLAQDAGWWPAYPATSRLDNKTYICSPCGTDEAMRDYLGNGLMPLTEWGPTFDDMTNEQGEHEHDNE